MYLGGECTQGGYFGHWKQPKMLEIVSATKIILWTREINGDHKKYSNVYREMKMNVDQPV